MKTVPTGYERESAHGMNANSNVTIAADGTSVLKVYYSLIRYTLVFNLNNDSVSSVPSYIKGHIYVGKITVPMTSGVISVNGQTYTNSIIKSKMLYLVKIYQTSGLRIHHLHLLKFMIVRLTIVIR